MTGWTDMLMNGWVVMLPILLPAAGALLIFMTAKNSRGMQRGLAFCFATAALIASIALFGRELSFVAGWAGFGVSFALELNRFSSFIVLVAGFTFLLILYSVVFMKDSVKERQFYAFVLLTSAFVSGAMLASNLVLMLFFWEGILGMQFALILTGGSEATPAAIKALIINATADLCLMLGVCLVGWQSGSLDVGAINLVPDNPWTVAAYVLVMIGAVAKAGSMPFHSWIPDAALVAPLPFMAFLPAAMEKILGIYLLALLNLKLFVLQPGSLLSLAVMIIGSATIILAVMMALIQKDYKRLLSYHAISQVGYMILGIGTALPIGIIGGLFHMVNHATYKSCLFYTAGAVERQTGTTDLNKLGGLGRKMPITCAGFIVAACAIAGVPPFNGFFSKELIFDAALEINVGFYIVAALGAFFTAASFLKLGHTVFFGKTTKAAKNAKEAPWQMLAPICVLALVCILFGVGNPLPLQGLIEPVLGSSLEHSFAGLPHNWVLVAISVAVLLLAVANHRFGVKRSGKPLGASDHFHYAPGLKQAYAVVETGLLDPYNLCGKVVDVLAVVLLAIDRAIDWIYSKLIIKLATLLAKGFNLAYSGRHWAYVIWVIVGAAAVAVVYIVSGGS